MDKLNFFINKKIVYVDIEWTRNKNMYLKIKDNNIIVSCPYGIHEKLIYTFVSKHIEAFVKYIDDSKAAELFSISKKFIWLNNKKYKLEILSGFSRSKFILNEKSVYIQTKLGEEEEAKRVIKNYLKKTLLSYIEKVSPHFEKILKVPPHKNKVVYKTRSWGTNMVSKRIISYSSRLGHYSNNVIDYVVIHELTHYHEPNHQKHFWELVESIMPNYKEVRKILKEDKALMEE